MNFKPFDALKVNLKGNNLIEASAGTGKTYSIAILVLRLVVEQNVSVNKILMVTFTNAAVAELKERIRKVLKEAYNYSVHKKINDKSIKSIIDYSASQIGNDTLQQRLKDAVLLIDELEIMTIHGFCQQTLNEFAFETNRIFGAELVTDANDILEDSVNKFWRKYITTLEPDLLSAYDYPTLKEEIKQVVKLHLDGKRYLPFDSKHKYTADDFGRSVFESVNMEYKERELQVLQSAIDTISANYSVIKDTLEAAKKSKDKEALLNLIDQPEAFLNYATKKVKTKVLNNMPDTFLDVLEDFKQTQNQSNNFVQTLKSSLYCFAIQEISYTVLAYMSNNNLLNFNSLIDSLHASLATGKNYRLVNELKKKYNAVFIDEFQDTDKSQYEIFETVFLRDYKTENNFDTLNKTYPFLKNATIAFLIGDPKQSIYGFRKSDIFTYFKARNFIGDNLFGMQVNYRSNALLIAAMNHFFQPDENFDAFSNTDENNSIAYQIIAAPENADKGTLYVNETPAVPIGILRQPNKDTVVNAVGQTVLSLLTEENNFILKSEQKRKVKPSDICVLVRSNFEGIAVKECLSNMHIPNVFISNSSILNSDEAIEMQYLLEAFLLPSKGNINRVCIGNYLGFTTTELLQIDEEILISRFLKYNEIWLKDGVYPAVMRFANEFGVLDNTQDRVANERLKANFVQLTELLNKTEHQKNLSQEEMISWLKKNIESADANEDENQVRIESDEQAVVITTIHKSKGLEYNIVLCPFLDFKVRTEDSFVNFRNNAGEYVFERYNALSTEDRTLYESQQEQENRRLIYVAITRAVLKCFVFKTDNNKNNNTSITPFVNHQNMQQSGLVEMEEVPEVNVWTYTPEIIAQKSEKLFAENFSLLQPNWSQWSYSKLSVHGEYSLKDKAVNFEDDYDKFIFETLPYGAATGSFLHHILEKIDFTNNKFYIEQISAIAQNYYSNPSENFVNNIETLLSHITQAKIVTKDKSFTLQSIEKSKRLQELEFNFILSPFQFADLLQCFDNTIGVQINTYNQLEAEGLIKGFIDLLFEHDGKYFIIDWKSNYLGYNPEDYTHHKLHEAMNANNYHLQYLIYCVAVKKYLSTRISNFDYNKHFGGVIYVFLRGVREGRSEGVYYTLPSEQMINKLEAVLSATTKETII